MDLDDRDTLDDLERAVRVAAAVIEERGRYLLTRRDESRDLAGYWEFPGGKLERGETAAEALARELREELGVEIGSVSEFTTLAHEYPGKTVALEFLETSIASGEPKALDVAAFGWFEPSEMDALPILPADRPVVEMLERRVRARDAGKGRDDA